ncbi:MAG: hypothetical protein R3D57_10145 [Hyphomicrobiaceae bacterium]
MSILVGDFLAGVGFVWPFLAAATLVPVPPAFVGPAGGRDVADF